MAPRGARHPQPDPDLALAYLTGSIPEASLFLHARRLRDEGKGRIVTYSRKVFIPLTTLCRDRCTYCTFAKPPSLGGGFMEPEEVLEVARAGEAQACTEALFTLGDRPEDRWPVAGDFLDNHGMVSTLDYVRAMTELVNRETGLFAHANPGVMGESDLAVLRPSNPSMGLMLENSSTRLTGPGMPHFGSPDKVPEARIETIRAAGRARVPFTTGILVGIGETPAEIVESLFLLADLAGEYGHIQEVIVQNFRAKADTAMRRHSEPVPAWFARVVALARWILGPGANIQVPPNLTERFETYLGAGANDWGGVSPLTIDFVNPEAPWPHLDELEARTNEAGFELLPRLPVHPEYLNERWIDPMLLPKLRLAADGRGYALAPQEAPT